MLRSNIRGSQCYGGMTANTIFCNFLPLIPIDCFFHVYISNWEMDIVLTVDRKWHIYITLQYFCGRKCLLHVLIHYFGTLVLTHWPFLIAYCVSYWAFYSANNENNDSYNKPQNKPFLSKHSLYKPFIFSGAADSIVMQMLPLITLFS